MRLATRATKSFDLLCPTLNSYTTPAYRCLACRSHVSRFSTSTTTSAKFTDRIRRTLWKSDKPPGANDPYNQSLNDDAQELDARAQAQEQEPEPYDDLTDTNSKAYQEAMKTYQPATTWEGLTEIGDIEEPELHFASWKGTTKLTAPHDLSYALRRAIIEVLVLQSSQARTPKILPVGRDYTRDANIVQSDDGPVITFANSTVRADITRSLREKPSLQDAAQAAEEATTNSTDAEEAVKADRSAEDPIEDLQAQSQATAWDPIWLQISLQDPAFKFSVSPHSTPDHSYITNRHLPRSLSAPLNLQASACPTPQSTPFNPFKMSYPASSHHPNHAQ